MKIWTRWHQTLILALLVVKKTFFQRQRGGVHVLSVDVNSELLSSPVAFHQHHFMSRVDLSIAILATVKLALDLVCLTRFRKWSLRYIPYCILKRVKKSYKRQNSVKYFIAVKSLPFIIVFLKPVCRLQFVSK